MFVVIAVAYASAEETVIEKEIEKVPVKVFPPGVDPLLCPDYPNCNNALLHSRKLFYPDYLYPGFSPLVRSVYNPLVGSVVDPLAGSVVDPTFHHPGRVLLNYW